MKGLVVTVGESQLVEEIGAWSATLGLEHIDALSPGQAVQLVKHRRPVFVFVEAVRGRPVLRELITSAGPDRVVVTSSEPQLHVILRALREGVRFFLALEDGFASFARGMGSKPTFWLSGRALEKVIDAILQLPEPFFAFNMESGLLTAREREVVSALTRGRSYEEAALELRISINTLRHHVRNAYRKSRLETAPGS